MAVRVNLPTCNAYGFLGVALGFKDSGYLNPVLRIKGDKSRIRGALKPKFGFRRIVHDPFGAWPIDHLTLSVVTIGERLNFMAKLPSRATPIINVRGLTSPDVFWAINRKLQWLKKKLAEFFTGFTAAGKTQGDH
jgi:hypothetical protein